MNVGDNWRGWTIEELLGEGAFGQVFKIVRHELGHDYYSALKVIHVPQGKSEYNALENQGMSEREIEVYLQDIVHDFSRELSVMDELKGNSNIVSYENHLIEQSPDGKSWTIYIRMELLTPLLKFYKYNYPDEEEIIKLGLDICSALEVCRLNKIIHRDIKPANIFVAKFGDYKLGDFGIARKLENTKSGLSKKGTYTYMAPEVYLGKPYNHTVDIYSLGIVLYILLNDSRAPFVPAPPEIPRYNEYDSALQRRMRGEALPPPRNASTELAKVVLKACAYDSRDRYQTPTELKKALKAVLNKPRLVIAPAAVPVEKPKPVKAETAQPKQKEAQSKPETATQLADKKKPETVTEYADRKKPETVTEYADRKKPETVTFQQEDIPFKPLTVKQSAYYRNKPETELFKQKDVPFSPLTTKQSAYNLKNPEFIDVRKKIVTAPSEPNNLSVPVQGTEAAKPKRKKGWKKAVIIPAVSLLVVVAIVFGVNIFQKPNFVAVGKNGYVSSWKDITEVAAGNYHTVGLKKDGTVVAVGFKGDGRCDVEDWTDITAIDAGWSHTVGLKKDGTVVAVGYNSDGQRDVENWTDITAIAAGGLHTVGIKKDGTVVAVGYKDGGRCDVENWTDITAIAAGVRHTIGLKKDGTVVATGDNDYGQRDVGDWTDIVAIAAGNYHTVGLKKDGTVVAVGYNSDGQRDVENWTDITAIAAGAYHTVGLKKDGTVVAVGYKEDGQCDVNDWKDIKSIYAGGNSTFGIKNISN